MQISKQLSIEIPLVNQIDCDPLITKTHQFVCQTAPKATEYHFDN